MIGRVGGWPVLCRKCCCWPYAGRIGGGDEIVEWGDDNPDFLRRFLPYHNGLPGARWLRSLMNRIDPALFSECFRSRAQALRPDVPDLVTIDGKTSRGSRNPGAGRAALHLVSAFATRERLVIGREAVAEGSCEQDTIPLLLEKLATSGSLDGALVTIDAIACNAKVAQAVLDARADYLLAVKASQPGLMAGIERFFTDAPPHSLDVDIDADKGHGRVEARVHEKGATRVQRRFCIASRKISAAALARAVRGHRVIDNSLHWVFDVVFREDRARSQTGHGPANMAVVRHFAFSLLRVDDDKRSIKLRRKKAGRNNQYLAQIPGTSLR